MSNQPDQPEVPDQPDAPGQPEVPDATAVPAVKPTVNILDAVCVLFFGSSGQMDVLVAILRKAGYAIFVPKEVLEEAHRRAEANGWGLSLDPHVGSSPGDPIRVIPTIDATQPAALALLAQVRARHPAVQAAAADPTVAASRHPDEDIGECVVITQAIMAKRQGHDVRVSIDDLRAQKLATAHNLDFFTIEDAFSAALEHEVLTTLEARERYDRLRGFGGSLPSWEAELGPRLKREKNARVRARREQRKLAGGQSDASR